PIVVQNRAGKRSAAYYQNWPRNDDDQRQQSYSASIYASPARQPAKFSQHDHAYEKANNAQHSPRHLRIVPHEKRHTRKTGDENEPRFPVFSQMPHAPPKSDLKSDRRTSATRHG